MIHKHYSQTRLSPSQVAILDMMRPGTRVLEIGCARGYMSGVMRNAVGCEVTAVEIDREMAEEARAHTNRVIVGDITEPDIWLELGRDYDYVIYADVLEHLADPWKTLRRTHEVLGPEGCVIVSVPNVAQYRIRLKMLLGVFEYQRYGIMDDTHLRFFTAKSARELFSRTGYEIVDVRHVNYSLIERPMMYIAPRLFAVQFVIKARPAPGTHR
ncbi:MAG: class I SAM-dependent methyltransferase [Armatimonadota bacterium]